MIPTASHPQQAPGKPYLPGIEADPFLSTWPYQGLKNHATIFVKFCSKWSGFHGTKLDLPPSIHPSLHPDLHPSIHPSDHGLSLPPQRASPPTLLPSPMTLRALHVPPTQPAQHTGLENAIFLVSDDPPSPDRFMRCEAFLYKQILLWLDSVGARGKSTRQVQSPW